MCSSTGKCCSFRGASTFQNHSDWLMIAKTKIICRQCGFYLVKNQKRLNCADRRDLRWCRTSPGNHRRKQLLFGSCLNAIFLSIRRRNFHHSCKICQLSFDLVKNKTRDLAAFSSSNFCSKMRHHFTLELDFSRTALQIATKTCPVYFHHKN